VLQVALGPDIPERDEILCRFGCNLKTHRVLAGLSQQGLSERCFLQHGRISQLERGMRSPSLPVFDGQDTAGMDAIQHRAFRDRQPEIEAAGYRVIAISSQSEQAQRRVVAENRLTHRLLSDPKLTLARELKLPTFPLDGARWYRRLMLVTSEGHVQKAFFPVSSPARSADQVIAWMTIQEGSN
jgi:peroxiredoxin